MDSKLCFNPKCKEANNSGFNSCWRCGAPLNETLELSEYKKYKPKKESFLWPGIGVAIWGLCIFFAAAFARPGTTFHFGRGAKDDFSPPEAMMFGISLIVFSALYIAVMAVLRWKRQRTKENPGKKI